MNKKITYILLILCFLFPGGLFSAEKAIEPTYSGHEKIGLSLKHEWQEAMKDGDLLRETSCIVSLERPVTKKKLLELKDAGLKIRTSFKTVITGRIHIGDLPFLVLVEGVQSVEGDSWLHFK